MESVQLEKKIDEIMNVVYLQNDSVVFQQQIAQECYKLWHITNMTIFDMPLV